MRGSSPCPSRRPVDLWIDPVTEKARGRCGCGYEGWVSKNGHLYTHHREVPGFAMAGLTRYEPSYTLEITVICQECGVLVLDTDVHDDWHNTVVEDLNAIRKELHDRPVPDRELALRSGRATSPDPPPERGQRPDPPSGS